MISPATTSDLRWPGNQRCTSWEAVSASGLVLLRAILFGGREASQRICRAAMKA